MTIVYSARNTKTAEMVADAEGVVMNFVVVFVLKRAGLAPEWAVAQDPLVRDYDEPRLQRSIGSGDFHMARNIASSWG